VTGGPESCAQFGEKGGIGKTSLTNGIAATAADRGMRVVVIDGDPRGTATDELGVEVRKDTTFTLNDLLYLPENPDVEPADPAEAIWDVLQPAGPAWPSNLWVIASERKLANREMDPRPFEGRLRRAITALEGEVDLVLADLAPRPGGRLVTAILGAMRKTVIPATLTTDGYEGVQHTLRSLRLMRSGGGPTPEVVGIARTMVPRDRDRRAIHNLFDELLQQNFGGMLLDVQIRIYTVREQARAAATPITAPGLGREAKILTAMYGQVLDRILAAKPEASNV
jgi:chromosome partitioning protein